jgi:hypothetical protein
MPLEPVPLAIGLRPRACLCCRGEKPLVTHLAITSGLPSTIVINEINYLRLQIGFKAREVSRT